MRSVGFLRVFLVLGLLSASKRVKRPTFKSKLIAEEGFYAESPVQIVSYAVSEELLVPATHITPFASAYFSGDPKLLEREFGRLLVDTTFHLLMPSAIAVVKALYSSETLRTLPLAEALRASPMRTGIYCAYGILLAAFRVLHLVVLDAPAWGERRSWPQVFALLCWRTHVIPGILLLSVFPDIVSSPIMSVPFIMLFGLYCAFIEYSVSLRVPRHIS